jgi:glycosyltransferase involved in cell wall biosynthesis
MTGTGMMIVLNDVAQDSRVLKMGAAMRRVFPEFVMIGMSKTQDRDVPYTKLKLNGFNCLLFPNYIKRIRRLKDEGESEYRYRRQKEGLEEFVSKIGEYSSTFRPTCLHTHDMLTLPIGRRIKELARERGEPLTWIHDIHEYTKGSSHMREEIQRFAVSLEEEHLREADVLLTVTEELKSRLENHYADLPPLHVIYNTPYFHSNDSSFSNDIRTELELGDQPLAVYAGVAKEKRGVDRMVPILKEAPNLHFAVVTNSEGPYIEAVKSAAIAARVEKRLHWRPYVPHRNVPQYLSSADLGVVPIENYGNAEIALPNKLFEYVFGGLPVAAHKLTAITKFFERYHIGELADFSDPSAAASAIQSILERRRENSAFEDARSAIIKEYAWEIQERKLLSLYLEAAGLPGDSCIDPVAGIRTKLSGIRVLHGPLKSAGQPGALAKAIDRLPDFSARSLQVTLSEFGYPADLLFPVLSTSTSGELIDALRSVVHDFDIFHFHARGFLFDAKGASLPTALDLLALKAAGKIVVFHFRGTEARLQSEFKALSPYHYVDDDEDQTNAKFPEAAKQRYMQLVSAIADRVFVVDAELQGYVPNSQIIERAIDLDDWQFVGVQNKERPLVVHAPSRRGVKGTRSVMSAVARLKRKGLDFDFELVEGQTNTEARKIYERADIVVDQLRIGWYGVLAVEAMALGKAVISYVRDDLAHHLGEEAPLAVATPGNIETVLEDLITNHELREKLGHSGRGYCERVHDATKIAGKLAEIYQEAYSNPKEIDIDRVLNYFAEESSIIENHRGKIRSLSKQVRSAATTNAATGRTALLAGFSNASKAFQQSSTFGFIDMLLFRIREDGFFATLRSFVVRAWRRIRGQRHLNAEDNQRIAEQMKMKRAAR